MASISTGSQTTAIHTGERPNYLPALATLTILFFMMGFITVLNDILVPYLKIVFLLNYTQIMLINTCFFGAYLVMSIPSGRLVSWIGYKKGMLWGFSVAGIGAFMFYPAAGLTSYPLFLLALFVLASGITLLQVAGNPYVAVLGAPETASARLTLTQAFNSVGTFVAPMVGTYLILSNLPHIPEELRAVRDYAHLNPTLLAVHKVISANLPTLQMFYVGLGVLFFAITLFIWRIPLPTIVEQSPEDATGEGRKSAWSYRHLVLGMLAIFFYVGAEVAIGSFLVNYFGQKYVAGMPEQTAGDYVKYYWGCAMVGRFLAAYILGKVSPARLLAIYGFFAALLVGVTIVVSGTISVYTIIAVGFFNSLMFPTIFTLAIAGLGRHTKQGSGLLSTAIVGGAVIPLIQGALADNPNITIRYAFIVPIICYIYVIYYGLEGYKTKAHGIAAPVAPPAV